MKPRFDPDNAVEVEGDIFDRFMEQMNARSQAKQLQQVSDALRVVMQMLRTDSDELLGKHRDDVEKMLSKHGSELESKLAEAATSMGESIDRITEKSDSLSSALNRMEKSVMDLASAPKGVEPDNAAIRGLVAEVAMLRSKIELPREDKMGALMDLVRSMKEAVPPKKSWRFSVERDEYARIKNVTAISD